MVAPEEIVVKVGVPSGGGANVPSRTKLAEAIIGIHKAAAIPNKYFQFLVPITTVRVLKGVNAEMSNVYGPLVHERGCERLEVFMRFPSIFFAKLPGCMPENLFSPNSPT
jgi:hypothetical protein